MANWVIDECIFEVAADQRNSKCGDAIYLVESIYRFHKIVLDHEGLLVSKYRRFYDQSKLLRSWFAKSTKNAGHIEYRSSTLAEAVSAKLDELRFDPDDKCFVGVALNADNLISSEDSDFHKEEIRSYFKNDIHLEVLTIEESIDKEAHKR
jgi:hypothetical protein